MFNGSPAANVVALPFLAEFDGQELQLALCFDTFSQDREAETMMLA